MKHTTQSNQRSNTNHKMMSKNKLRSKTVQVDPKFVGATIGPKGETVKGIAASAGKGCRIQHQRENKGTFVLSAWDASTLLRAEIKLREHIQQLEKKPKKKVVSQKVNSTGSRFESLQEPVPSTHSNTKTRSKTETVETNFKLTGTIKARKRTKWYNHHASEEEKKDFDRRHGKSPTPIKEPEVPGPESFPALVETSPSLQTSIWSSAPEEVRSERVKTPPPPPPSSLETLETGKDYSEPEELNFTPIKRVVEDQPEEDVVEQGDEGAFTEDEDEEEMEDEEEEDEEEEEWESWDDQIELVSGKWADEEW